MGMNSGRIIECRFSLDQYYFVYSINRVYTAVGIYDLHSRNAI